jgi:hypothetical protein
MMKPALHAVFFLGCHFVIVFGAQYLFLAQSEHHFGGFIKPVNIALRIGYYYCCGNAIHHLFIIQRKLDIV